LGRRDDGYQWAVVNPIRDLGFQARACDGSGGLGSRTNAPIFIRHDVPTFSLRNVEQFGVEQSWPPPDTRLERVEKRVF
jgi:hypothetical protein